MAIGMSLLFGVRLPLNFNSPYKARNIIEFWRCWHMTLSRFLRDYLYIPLGGSKKGVPRRYLNLMTTMLLGGLWHGAGWTFVIWGGLHGIYLVINHGWRALLQRLGWNRMQERRPYQIFSWMLTFLAVVAAWVFFRAESMKAALSVLKGMVGLNGVVLPERFLPKLGSLGHRMADMGVGFAEQVSFTGSEFMWIAGLLLVVFLMPNTQQIMARCKPVLTPVSGDAPASVIRLSWKPTALTAVVLAAITFAGIAGITKASEFLYFQF
jgi:D-alanyl-lipoteichoic acid acyltransferase DltB (MBOAT superfamily)